MPIVNPKEEFKKKIKIREIENHPSFKIYNNIRNICRKEEVTNILMAYTLCFTDIVNNIYKLKVKSGVINKEQTIILKNLELEIIIDNLLDHLKQTLIISTKVDE